MAVDHAPDLQVTEKPVLLYSWVCPYVQRVTLALAHKKAKLDHIEIDLGNKPSWLTKYSPLGKVPAVTYLEDGKQQVLYESLALVPWVDEYFKGPELLPGSAAQRTKARIIISRVDNNLIAAWNKGMRCNNKEEFAELWKTVQTELKWLEENIDPQGPFLLGAQPTMVDVVVAPWLLRAGLWKHFRNVDPLKGSTRLHAFLEAYKALPEVSDNLRYPGGVGFEGWQQALLDRYTTYAGQPTDFSSVVEQ